MQAAPPPAQAVSALGSHPSAAPHSSRQYQQPQPPPQQQQHPPQARDRQYGQQPANASAASPPSARRPTRRSSGNAAPTTPQLQSSAGPDVASPRNLPLPPSAQASPSTGTAAGKYNAFAAARADQHDGAHGAHGAHDAHDARGAPAASPRTSSNPHLQQADATADPAAAPGELARPSDDGLPSSRPATSGEGRERRDRRSGAGTHVSRDRAKDNTAAAAALAAQTRRKVQQSPREERPPTSPVARESRAQRSPRSAQGQAARADTAAAAAALPREPSAVINRVVVTDPAVDLAREKERLAEAQPSAAGTDVTPVTGLGLVGDDGVEDGGRGGAVRTRQDYSASASRRKETRFGEYILGQTLGEGEFGKVKMGWKKEGGVQVAIKLIRRESLGTNPTRLPKIYREISILRELSHPNIVRLHEMVETERHIGIILEYASGGELFDYILTHRYLKDQAARRLFAQLVSGVGYLHKKGIVHRDLKLENLLLDRNRNIIITDFGFANTFDPDDELGDEIEYNLTSRDFVRKNDLERVRESGHRRGDLMQTSCGSPCYAAPELVVSDSLYTGRKVDVWSCGVILYAMLAGYLPFDDDPANPEGDNINLLYKYIVSTPLTFPEYVTPHARDLLRRILVADPRLRADLFEVARHSWLSEYAHVVSFITSSTTTTGDITNTTVTADDHQDVPLLARSASVREPSKPHQPHVTAVGALAQKHGTVDQDAQATQPKPQRDAKRRTVQVEYVAPQSQTARGDALSPTAAQGASPTAQASPSRTRTKAADKGPVEASSNRVPSTTKPLPQEPVKASPRQTATYNSVSVQSRTRQRPASLAQDFGGPTRPRRDNARSVSDSADALTMGAAGTTGAARPRTGGSMASTGSMGVPSRGSYAGPGQPAAPAVAATYAQGKLAQPKGGNKYVISDPSPQRDDDTYGPSSRPSTSARPQEMAQNRRPVSLNPNATGRGHKRSNTVGGLGERLFGRSGSLFGGRSSAREEPQEPAAQKSYPPTSMPAAMVAGNSRTSTESRRSVSYGAGRKSGLAQEKPRAFSLLGAFSSKNHGNGASYRANGPPGTAQSASEQQDSDRHGDGREALQAQGSGHRRALSRETSQDTSGSGTIGADGQQAGYRTSMQQATRNSGRPSSGRQQPHAPRYPTHAETTSREGGQYAGYAQAAVPSAMTTESESSLNPPQRGPGPYPPGFNSYDEDDGRTPVRRAGRGPGVLQKSNRKFVDAYEQEPERRFASGNHNSGSSGAARKVMDFFRRRGKARVGDDR
ncbi:MAG: hypothetical protein M1832_005228 [Thelocarpon impressellum]|nr:MAG: hypothetical protein M1832_005228 [Thelocarpon impressellum]